MPIQIFLLELSAAIDQFEEFEMLRQMEEVQRDDTIDLTSIPDVLDRRMTILNALANSEGLFR